MVDWFKKLRAKGNSQNTTRNYCLQNITNKRSLLRSSEDHQSRKKIQERNCLIVLPIRGTFKV